MEEHQTYTYKKKENTVDPVKVVLLIVAVIVLLGAGFAGAGLGKKKAELETTVPVVTEAATAAAESTSVAPQKYLPGDYVIQTGGYTLLLRAEPTRESEDLTEIPDETAVVITEITEIPDAEDEVFRYWGRTSYDGVEGWVPMGYLAPDGAVVQEPENAVNWGAGNQAPAIS